MSGNSFELRQNYRQQHLKEQPEPAASTSTLDRLGGVRLPAPKLRRKQCSLYLDAEMMEQVKQVARRRNVTIGAVIETCVKMSLGQLEK